MASKALCRALAVAACLSALGCVSVRNSAGLTPPAALCSSVRGTVGCPKESVPCVGLRTGKTDETYHVKEWVFTGISAGIVDMALQKAIDNGGLKKVYYADYEQVSYLGFVTVFNLTAYGE